MKRRFGGVGILSWALGLCWVLESSLSAQPEFKFTQIQRSTNAEIALKLTALQARNYRFEFSSDLTSWQGLALLTNSSGLVQYTDSGAPYLSNRFYRCTQITGTNVLTGDYFSTTNGEGIIHPINHASFVMSWDGKTIYVDPVGGATRYQGLSRANLILVTHDHSDHFDATTINAVKATNGLIVAPLAVYQSLSASLKTITTVLTNGASASILGVFIEAVPAYNTSNSNHPRGRGNGYILSLADKRVYVSGDTEDTVEMRAIRNLEVMFINMNQYTMTVNQGVSATRQIQPRVVYPCHYQSGGFTADVNAYKRLVGADLGIEVRLRNWY
jgi:L-ascorbate metabolism protein UlaG (beta-lactamase superfamily)